MRNVAISADASFGTAALPWMKGNLPLSLLWRSTWWRVTVPGLWLPGFAFWLWVLSVDPPDRSLAFYAVLFIGIPLMLATSAGWWIGQLLNRRHTGTLMINSDYLEWQYEVGSTVELLAECGRFKLAGRRDADARIEWNAAPSWDATASGWPEWTKAWRKPVRSLYGRDLGLDRDDLESLCKLLNELREDAKAER